MFQHLTSSWKVPSHPKVYNPCVSAWANRRIRHRRKLAQLPYNSSPSPTGLHCTDGCLLAEAINPELKVLTLAAATLLDYQRWHYSENTHPGNRNRKGARDDFHVRVCVWESCWCWWTNTILSLVVCTHFPVCGWWWVSERGWWRRRRCQSQSGGIGGTREVVVVVPER